MLRSLSLLYLIRRYRWAVAAFVAIHPITYLLMLTLPAPAMTILLAAVIVAFVVLGAVWLVAVCTRVVATGRSAALADRSQARERDSVVVAV